MVAVSEMEETTNDKNKCGYTPDFENSTLNAGEHKATESEQLDV